MPRDLKYASTGVPFTGCALSPARAQLCVGRQFAHRCRGQTPRAISASMIYEVKRAKSNETLADHTDRL